MKIPQFFKKITNHKNLDRWAAIVTILGFIIGLYTCSNDEDKQTQINDNSKNIHTNNSSNYYEINNSTQEASKSNVTTYSIIGCSSPSLMNKIERAGNYKIRNGAKNTILITTNGSLIPSSSDTNKYIFTGGNLIILINGICEKSFTDYRIPQMRIANKVEIEKEISEIVCSLLEQNIENIFKGIKECLSEN